MPAVIADEVFAFVGYVLCDFGEEVEAVEDLEIALGTGSQVGTGGTGEATAVVLFRAVDDGALVGQRLTGSPLDLY